MMALAEMTRVEEVDACQGSIWLGIRSIPIRSESPGEYKWILFWRQFLEEIKHYDNA
jgi:hypothetical protein